MHFVPDTRYLLICHSLAAKGNNDMNRSLTSEGMARARAFPQGLVRKFSQARVFSSPTMRARQTARCIVGGGSLEIIPELYSVQQFAEEITCAFRELGHVPLGEYVSNGHHAIPAMGRLAAERVWAREPSSASIIFGHSLLLQGLLLALTDDPSVVEVAMRTVLHECGAIELCFGSREHNVQVEVHYNTPH